MNAACDRIPMSALSPLRWCGGLAGIAGLVLALLLNGAAVVAQEATVTDTAPEVSGEVATMRALASSLSSLAEQLKEKQAIAKRLAGTPEAASAQAEITGLEERRSTLERDLMAVAAGATLDEYLNEAAPEEELTLQQEISRLLSPMLAEVRKLSQKPRALQELQNQLDKQQHRVRLAELAVASLQARGELLKAADEPTRSSLSTLLVGMQESWQTRLDESRSRVLALERQLAELRAEETSVWSLLAGSARNFVFTRGLYLLLALAAFVAVFFSLRLFYFYGVKMIPATQLERLSFFRRLIGLLNQALSLALASLAALAVLYASGDWLLGGLAVLLMLGILLAAKSGLVRYFEQVRMLLNLGSAREGERVLIDGVPWLIGTINFQTRLTNPCLDGPGLRLPLEALMTMNSRPCAPNEPWFPCRSGDIILIGEDLMARVERASPDLVEIRYRGGVTRHIPTPAFLTLQPANLSGGFLASTTIGLDYSLQADITRRIPALMQEDVRTGLLRCVPEEHLIEVRVEFKEAAASSLDLWIGARFTGDAAERYLELRRLLQELAVESCTANRWPIPFPQMVVHRPA